MSDTESSAAAMTSLLKHASINAPLEAGLCYRDGPGPIPFESTRSSSASSSVSLAAWRRFLKSRTPSLEVALFALLLLLVGLLLFANSGAPSTPATSSTPTHTASAPKAPAAAANARFAGIAAEDAGAAAVGASKPPLTRLNDRATPPIVKATVVARLPHDATAFTQGLLVHDGAMYESTGLYGQSTVRRVDLATGEVLDQYQCNAREFGEGLALFNDQLIQLTWQDHVAYVYDLANYTAGPVKSFPVATEGWGLTHDGRDLILSDGSDTLFFLDPKTYAVKRRVRVRWFRQGAYHAVPRLNELEYIDGVVYANIWMTNYIVLIDPTTGVVVKVIDAAHLHPAPHEREMTLNGIAWDEVRRKLYITGKLWPVLYEIDFVGA